MSETALAKSKSETKERTIKKQTTAPSLNMAELRELAELVNEHGFTDFEFENANIRVRLSKMIAAPIVQTVQPAVSAPVAATVQNETVTPETPTATDEDLHKITSPIVGTFYASPAPDKDAYVSLGDKVSENTTVCIVEAMKLMNEIQAEVSGEVVKIYVENGQPVEYGQPLFGIRK
ncbi:MAG TPA: acetyl-CoA carboxylase biotin carboxyl carrier protein [Pyrinomonadaceae bacterium]|nr:acetyl-CoA carboxylase biotin carboxyl carrier protein [Pyrinomonadaceae bacterium]